MNIETMLEELRYPGEIEEAVLKKIRKDEKNIEKIAKTAYLGKDLNFELCRRMPLTRLSVVTYLLLQKYDEYKAKGVPDGIIFDTFRDVSLRSKLYYDGAGKIGISKADVIWFRHIMNGVIFKLGTLQFQLFEMVYLDEETIGEPYMEFTKEQKAALPAGTPVINCHVQQGADLSPNAVKNSFDGARRFFKAHFPLEHPRAFLCYSWLLYPQMVERLYSGSNIKRFAEMFTIIGSCADCEQANEYLFERCGRKTLPPNATFLQKLAYEHSELLGFACGIAEI